jgi:hypothetical protein
MAMFMVTFHFNFVGLLMCRTIYQKLQSIVQIFCYQCTFWLKENLHSNLTLDVICEDIW